MLGVGGQKDEPRVDVRMSGGRGTQREPELDMRAGGVLQGMGG